MDTATDTFHRLRPRLFGIAYRMLGLRADAEDIVQEAWLRWHMRGSVEAHTPEAWLVTVVTRLSIDRLRGMMGERERYVGPWLPEPLLDAQAGSPAEALELASDISTAFLLMLERLGPEERAVFLLHQVFDVDYPEVAAMVGKTEAACRKIVQRARERVRAERPRFTVQREAHLALLGRFIEAARSYDPQQVMALLTDDATYTGDGGGKARTTVRIVAGAGRVARLVAGIERKWTDRGRHEIIMVNGEPGLLTWRDGMPDSVTSFDLRDGRIAAIYVVRNPDKLGVLNAKISARAISK
ncbi:RNA polymerase sigma factor SigJ [Massilia solisilvae]|uniref:RNA polymerase sigma factor SigJ n=1 Tax=Massilia solisilvae TaxID=1811225 RepID=A0ABT2BGI7_9BURK|nr:RNA polymerase sigma factor SigJ [Massilia solisilvae]MCS0607633.1 RNA polymerase sigma factor SigJ [Massilia solisilvae]